MELTGANADAYVNAISEAFGPNLEPGMKRIANSMALVWASEGRASEG